MFNLIKLLFPFIVIGIILYLIWYVFNTPKLNLSTTKKQQQSNITVKTIVKDLPIKLEESDELFNPLMTSQGERIDISNINLEHKGSWYSANIDDFTTKTEIKNGEVQKLECNCSFKGYCKHEYALLKVVKKHK